MNGQMKIVKSENKPEPIFANGIGIRLSIFEGRLEFIRETPGADDNEIIQETVADIRVSPQLAKTISLFLQDHISKYEKQFGDLAALTIPQGDADV